MESSEILVFVFICLMVVLVFIAFVVDYVWSQKRSIERRRAYRSAIDKVEDKPLAVLLSRFEDWIH